MLFIYIFYIYPKTFISPAAKHISYIYLVQDPKLQYLFQKSFELCWKFNGCFKCVQLFTSDLNHILCRQAIHICQNIYHLECQNGINKLLMNFELELTYRSSMAMWLLRLTFPAKTSFCLEWYMHNTYIISNSEWKQMIKIVLCTHILHFKFYQYFVFKQILSDQQSLDCLTRGSV